MEAIAGGLKFGGMLGAAWRYRHFVLSSIRKEYRARFARSKLGALWMIVHPLVNAAIFALVLAEVMSAKLPGMVGDRFAYAIYVTSGMLAWSLFAEVVSRCLGIFIESGPVMKKLYFPRICLPLIVTGIAVLNNLLMYAAILLIFALLGRLPTAAAALVPLLMLVPLALGLGLGLLLGVLNVFARDVGQVVPIVLQLAFWLTPIVYLPSMLPPWVAPVIAANPMTPVVEAYQHAMLGTGQPDWLALFAVTLLALGLLALALFMFRRASVELVDAL
ncbi:MAG TPA: ABC transporter permease [Casimicrobiaceae bacterium]|nr:ABC transporter permease [Casimicrobiaceae bacterium]